MKLCYRICFLLCASFLPSSLALITNTIDGSNHFSRKLNRFQLSALPCPLPALFAGSIAGAVGVGVAYPLDTLKTRTQVMSTGRKQTTDFLVGDSSSPVGALALPNPPLGNNMAEVADYILQTEGVDGFFAGVQTSMIGQAIIKAVVFAANAYMVELLQGNGAFDGNTNLQLLFAAASAGFIASFLAAPVDRIKVLMQAGGSTYQGRDDQAFQAVLKTEGWKGLLGRGLFCTMLREIPAYSLYFGVYGTLINWNQGTENLGPWAPLLFGATAGCACWLPIYPIDVVKTFIQNTEGNGPDQANETSIIQVATELYQIHGFGVFWDGLAPRLLRQAVNHATTFALYERLLNEVFLKI
jgi:solute carrier family 25 carnitine/acylcarnitine transporter 20/29